MNEQQVISQMEALISLSLKKVSEEDFDNIYLPIYMGIMLGNNDVCVTNEQKHVWEKFNLSHDLTRNAFLVVVERRMNAQLAEPENELLKILLDSFGEGSKND